MVKQTICWSLMTLQGLMILSNIDIRNRFLLIAGQIWPSKSAQMEQLGELLRVIIAVSIIPAAFGNFWLRVFSISMYAVFICNYYNPMVLKGTSQAFFINSAYDMLLLIFGLLLIIQQINKTYGPERQASTTISIKSQINEEDIKDEELKVLHTNSSLLIQKDDAKTPGKTNLKKQANSETEVNKSNRDSQRKKGKSKQ